MNESNSKVLVVGKHKPLPSLLEEYINHASELPLINIQESNSLQLDVFKETSDE